jgi:MYXO-CTERM domain-containing protein
VVAAPSCCVNNLTPGFVVGATLGTAYAWRSGANYIDPLHASAAASGFGGGAFGSNYFGFRFLSGTDLLYGWTELILSTTDGGTVTVNRWAYEDTPDYRITMGQTDGDNCPSGETPAPPTLALLAAGAFGLRRWRARRAAA